jgi:hypothetical protein
LKIVDIEMLFVAFLKKEHRTHIKIV